MPPGFRMAGIPLSAASRTTRATQLSQARQSQTHIDRADIRFCSAVLQIVSLFINHLRPLLCTLHLLIAAKFQPVEPAQVTAHGMEFCGTQLQGAKEGSQMVDEELAQVKLMLTQSCQSTVHRS